MNETPKILVVDDEESVRGIIHETLSSMEYDVVEANSAEKALSMLQERPFDLVLSDIRMEGLSGLKLLKSIKGLELGPEVIIMTSFGSMDSAVEALREGAYDYLLKPFEDLEIISTSVRRALEKRKLVKENSQLVQTLKLKNEELKTAAQKGAHALADEKTGRTFIEKILLSSNASNPPQALLTEACKLFRTEKAGLWVVDMEKGHFQPVGNTGLPPEKVVPIPFPVSKNSHSRFEVTRWVKNRGHLPYLDEIKKMWGGETLNYYPLEIGNEIQGLLVWAGKPFKAETLKSWQETFLLVAGVILKDLSEKTMGSEKTQPETKKSPQLNTIQISDEITPFFHFDFFQEILNMEIKRSTRYEHPLSVCLVIIHPPAGIPDNRDFDRLVHELSVRIYTRIRRSDFPAREGNKFFLGLPETGKPGAGKLLLYLNNNFTSFRKQHHSDPLRGKFSWNFASVEFPKDAETIEGIIAGLETQGHQGLDKN